MSASFIVLSNLHVEGQIGPWRQMYPAYVKKLKGAGFSDDQAKEMIDIARSISPEKEGRSNDKWASDYEDAVTQWFIDGSLKLEDKRAIKKAAEYLKQFHMWKMDTKSLSSIKDPNIQLDLRKSSVDRFSKDVVEKKTYTRGFNPITGEPITKDTGPVTIEEKKYKYIPNYTEFSELVEKGINAIEPPWMTETLAHKRIGQVGEYTAYQIDTYKELEKTKVWDKTNRQITKGDVGWCVYDGESTFNSYGRPYLIILKDNERVALHSLTKDRDFKYTGNRPVKDLDMWKILIELLPMGSEEDIGFKKSMCRSLGWNKPDGNPDIARADQFISEVGMGNIKDSAVLLQKFEENFNNLIGYVFSTRKEGGRGIDDVVRSYEPVILRNRKKSFEYLVGVLVPLKEPQGILDPFEDVIMSHPVMALKYAISLKLNNMGNGRFEKGEASIASNPKTAVLYADKVLGGPFKMGEPAILTDSQSIIAYAMHVLKGRFREGEDVLKAAGDGNVNKLYVDGISNISKSADDKEALYNFFGFNYVKLSFLKLSNMRRRSFQYSTPEGKCGLTVNPIDNIETEMSYSEEEDNRVVPSRIWKEVNLSSKKFA